MLQVQYVFLLIIESLALVTYIPGNIFVIVKTLQDWMKNRRHSTFLQLIMGVSGINIIQGLLKFISTFFMKYFECPHLKKIYLMASLVLTSCNLWFSTWLCIYYCLQTVHIKLKFYCSIQKRFPEMVPRLHALSILVSTALIIPSAWKTSGQPSLNATSSTLPPNATSIITVESNGLISCIGSILEQISYLVSALGFLLMFGSSMSIIISLCVNNIGPVISKTESPKSQDAESLKASVLHMDAAKAVSSIVGINVVLTVAVNILASAAGGAIWILVFSIVNTMFQIFSCLNLMKGHLSLSDLSINCVCSKKYFDKSEN